MFFNGRLGVKVDGFLYISTCKNRLLTINIDTMASEIKIYCKNFEEYIEIGGGESLLSVSERVKDRLGFSPICATVNNKVRTLRFEVFAPVQVEFFDSSSRLGDRVYILSLCMLLYKAVHDLFPERVLRIEHSVANGIYCQLHGDGEAVALDAHVVAAIRQRMQQLADADLPFEPHVELTTDVVEKLKAQGLADKAQVLATTHNIYTTYFSLDGTIDTYYCHLAPSTACLKPFDLMPYKDGMLLLTRNVDKPSEVCKPICQDKVFEAFGEYNRLNRIIGIKNVGELNRAVENKYDIRTLITVAEAVHERKFAGIAFEIAKRYKEGGARVVLLAGPSSSGKTTSSKRLAIQLMANLLVPKVISLDNYFVNRDDTPLDENGEKDFESLYALDLDLFNRDLNDLIAGKEVAMPTYNFEKGAREYRGDTLKLGPNTVLLMEGIHGLNPELTAAIAEEQKFRVYASALSTINIDDHNWLTTSDNRLLRRIVRDHKYRGTSARDTIARWPSVRRGEKKWIFPYQENADAIFNSSLIFELGVMRDYADEILRQVPRDVPEYAEASRLRHLLSFFEPISSKCVPGNSLLREFLGGSTFHY